MAPTAAVVEYGPPGNPRIAMTIHVIKIPTTPVKDTGANAAKDFRQLNGYTPTKEIAAILALRVANIPLIPKVCANDDKVSPKIIEYAKHVPKQVRNTAALISHDDEAPISLSHSCPILVTFEAAESSTDSLLATTVRRPSKWKV